jgi:hypothetical protein
VDKYVQSKMWGITSDVSISLVEWAIRNTHNDMRKLNVGKISINTAFSHRALSPANNQFVSGPSSPAFMIRVGRTKPLLLCGQQLPLIKPSN